MRRSQSCSTVSVTSPARNPGTSSTGAPSPCGTSWPRQVSLTSSRASSRCTRASPSGRPHQRSGGGSSATLPDPM